MNRIRVQQIVSVWAGPVAGIAAAAVCGAIPGQILVVWTTMAGTTASALNTLVCGVFAGVLLSLLYWKRFWQKHENGIQTIPADERSSTLPRIRQILMHVATSVVAMLLVWLTPELLTLAVRAGSQCFAQAPDTLRSTSGLSMILTMFFPGLVIAVLTASAVTWYLNTMQRTGTLSGVAAGGLGMSLLLLHAWISVPLAATVSAGIVLTVVLQQLVPAGPLAAPPVRTVMTSDRRQKWGQWRDVLTALAASLTLAAVLRLVSMQTGRSLPVTLMSLTLVSWFLSAATRCAASRLISGRMLAGLSVFCVASLPLVFDRLTMMNFELRSSVSVPFILLFLRSVQTAFFAAAALIPWTMLLAGRLHSTAGGDPVAPRFSVRAAAVFAAGMLAGPAVMQWTEPAFLLAAGVVLQIPVLLSAAPARVAGGTESTWLTQLRQLSVPALLLVPLSLILSSEIRTAQTDQLLFSKRSLAAAQLGLEQDLILQSDASRLMETAATDTGDVNVWRRNGEIFEFLRNGVSLGQFSRDTRLTPQPVQEILPALLPLVAHEAPHRILLLGDQTGACLRVCSHFPAQRIVAIRSCPDVTELAKAYTWVNESLTPDQDPRVSLLHESPLVAINATPQIPFDVVISTSASVSSTDAAWEFTEEYYDAARRQLSPDGIFCQRFAYQDLGAEPLRAVMSTAMTAFRHVVAIQTVPGEMVLLSTNSDARFPGSQILDRLQLDYIREEIAATGWDWTQIAVLPMLDAADPVGMFSHQLPPAAINISNARFALQLPLEAGRRISRSAELQQAFAPYQMRLAEAIPPAEAHQEINRRLNLVNQEIEILAGMPDEPWTYRKSLRMEMQRNPHPPQEVIRDNEIIRTAHPVDQMHQDYFLTLSDANRNVLSGRHTYDAFSGLSRFAAQSEPLMSRFAYYELVRLHELANHPNPQVEYQHRLRTVFFTEHSDASVRPVISAIQLLIEHPEIVPDDAERFDQLNSMVQKLIERWEARTAWEPRSARRVENDVNQSVLVTGLAIAKLEEWAPAAGMSDADFVLRRRFIHAALTRPLREYGEQVLAHRLKFESAMPESGEQDGDLPLMLNPQDLTN